LPEVKLGLNNGGLKMQAIYKKKVFLIEAEKEELL
jgi:hypothetical protein